MLKTEFQFANIRVSPCTVLSPMAGVTDAPFRRLCRVLAGNRMGLLVSEFVSTDGTSPFVLKNHKQLKFYPEERPFGIQIFGRSPERMAYAAQVLETLKPDYIEVNAGCPVPKVAGKGGGAGLLKDLPRLQKILAEVKKSIAIPMTLKCRIGWDENSINVMETLKIAEGEGADMLTVHGRTRVQGYNGFANWDLIGQVAAAAKIPVVGNGDVSSVQFALDCLEKYAICGVSIGRGAMHNPWLFGEIADALEGKLPRKISAKEVCEIFKIYYGFMMDENTSTPFGALGRLKQLAARLCKGFEPDSSEFRQRVLTSQSPEELFENAGRFSEFAQSNGITFTPERLVNLNGRKEDTVSFERQFK
ncbi:tRNA dihydrouridine synthase [Hallerella porci]|uniref:tRNA-dihydrouridine synthase n=1 Tax=Hallerella porci TaxID=1945871 RepID=A0ABX5LL89_9BACT|nr:tRNA-dihydrouridine synthase [Hallerella porci]PWK93114.1 nifR3 family TIM-barrel protein [Hallerella porci]